MSEEIVENRNKPLNRAFNAKGKRAVTKLKLWHTFFSRLMIRNSNVRHSFRRFTLTFLSATSKTVKQNRKTNAELDSRRKKETEEKNEEFRR